MKLYGANLSPFYERIMMLLAHKGATDRVSPSGVPGGAMKSPEHYAMNPFGKIPFAELDCGTVLLEAQIIVEYLDSVTDGPKVVPSDPVDAARASLIARICDLYLWPAMWAVVNHYFWHKPNPDAVKEAVEDGIPKALDALERYVDAKAGFAVGQDWSYADFALVPIMFQYTHILPQVGITDFGDRPKLTDWWQKMQEKEAMQQSHARMQKSLDFIMARMKGA